MAQGKGIGLFHKLLLSVAIPLILVCIVLFLYVYYNSKDVNIFIIENVQSMSESVTRAILREKSTSIAKNISNYSISNHISIWNPVSCELQSFKHFLGEDSSNSHVYIIDTSSRKILLSDGVESLPGDFNERFHDDEEFWRTLDRALTEGEGSVDLYQFARGHNGLPGGAVGAAAIAGSDLMVLAVGAPDAISVAAAEFGEAVRARFHRTYLSVLGTLAILLLWVSTSLFLVTRRITRSISQMVAQAEAISLGNFDTTLNVRRGDELGELARALDRMRFSLKAALERLRRRR